MITSTTKGAPWRLTAAPALTGRPKVTGSAKVKATYEACHLAWRAGLIRDFYYGKRSPSDYTLVWRVDDVEYAAADLDAVNGELGRRRRAHQVADIAWGGWWCGFREVIVTYASGAMAVERWDSTLGRKVVETVEAVAAVA